MPTSGITSSTSLAQLREEVLDANLELVRRGLVLYTFGNASGILREEGLVVIKPSGVPYDEMKPEHLVVTDLDGKILEGNLRPSSDLPTHLVLYRAFQEIGGVVHTHSEYATAWAQARREIPCFGTTHADYFHGPVQVTESMPDQEIASAYEENTGAAIVRAFRDRRHNAAILEAIARMAYFTTTLNPQASPIGRTLHDRHYLRKHGSNSYYGQPKEGK